MGVTFKPWGALDWLLPKTGITNWHFIGATSFEDRCTGAVESLRAQGHNILSSSILCIENPASEFWAEGKVKRDENIQVFSNHLAGPNYKIIQVGLQDLPKITFDAVAQAPSLESVILDITTLPKRFFLHFFNRLIARQDVKNLVVTYCRAASYPEAALCAHALPPAPIYGFARIEPSRGNSRLVVDVGYVALSIDELLQDFKNSRLDFIFPFPPGSPAYRRNWSLLSMLMPESVPNQTEIHRIDSMDAFEVFERIRAWGGREDLNLLPLGPKPHALGMAMAFMRLNGTAEILYAQPLAYAPNYSVGVGRNQQGLADIYGYCLKRGGKALF